MKMTEEEREEKPCGVSRGKGPRRTPSQRSVGHQTRIEEGRVALLVTSEPRATTRLPFSTSKYRLPPLSKFPHGEKKRCHSNPYPFGENRNGAINSSTAAAPTNDARTARRFDADSGNASDVVVEVVRQADLGQHVVDRHPAVRPG